MPGRRGRNISAILTVTTLSAVLLASGCAAHHQRETETLRRLEAAAARAEQAARRAELAADGAAEASQRADEAARRLQAAQD
jgi:hypothetical protein